MSAFGGFPQEELVFDSPDNRGEPSKTVSMASWRFLKEFWASFGRDHARGLAEAHCTQVRVGLLRFLLEAWFYVGLTLFSFIWHESKPKETAQATPGAAARVQAGGDAEKA